jgi:hypothetical protein
VDPELQELEESARRRRTLTFVGALALLLSAMGLAVIQAAYPPGYDLGGVNGEIRPIPPSVLRSQLRSQRLSDREAEHWRPEPLGMPR